MDLRTMIPLPITPLIQAAIGEDLEASKRLDTMELILFLSTGGMYDLVLDACLELAKDEFSNEQSKVSTDPDNFWSGRRLLIQLKRLAIRGPDIHFLYAYVCGKNAARMAGLLCAAHYKICDFRPVDIHYAIRAKNSKGIDWRSLMTGVKQTLPAFNVEAALADGPDPD